MTLSLRSRAGGVCYGFFVVLGLAWTLSAQSKTNGMAGYEIILQRNPFGLKAPAKPNPSSVTQFGPRLSIRLTGIFAYGTDKQAFFVADESGQQPRYLRLREGERQGELELLKIDVGAGRVVMRNAGAQIILSFAASGTRRNGTAAPVKMRTVVKEGEMKMLHDARGEPDTSQALSALGQ